MQLYDETSCFNEITAYFNSDLSGYPFIANIDDNAVMQGLISRMQADSSKSIIRVSDYCKGDSLPNVFSFKMDVKKVQSGIVLGYVLNDMLCGEQQLKKTLSELLQLSVAGHVVVLIYGCAGLLKNAIYADGNRANRRTIILEKESFVLPSITMTAFADSQQTNMHRDFSSLLQAMESLSYDVNSSNLLVHTAIKANVYKNSVLQIDTIGRIYDILCKNYPDINAGTEEKWGSEKQWKMLYDKIKKAGSLSKLIDKEFSSVYNLHMMIRKTFTDIGSDRAWLLWIGMKVFGTKENKYLSAVVKKSESVANLVELIFMDLLCYHHTDADFEQLYQDRKQLIESLPNKYLAQIQNYCNLVGQYDRDAVYYLTNLSDKEKLTFLSYLEKKDYTYSEEEIRGIVKYAFPEIYEYLSDFEFTDRNTKNPTNDPALLSMLTTYFHDYKLQKVKNRIFPEFMKVVESNAVSRPFMKLLPRISVVKDIDKTNTQVHFFDALGVEYLAYIIKKCETLDLQAVVHVAHCELPSITKMNKDFTKFFQLELDENGEPIIPGTKKLDKLKHHDTKIDYRKCKEPIHLFFELSIIDEELNQIQEMLANHRFDKVLIISDHGASRLSVIHQTECDMLKLENNGEESGRCCQVKSDPHIPEATYENGYAVLANYDRFRGSRPANVEVHGGASLEETVVPIIEITQKPKNLDVHIINADKSILFHNKEIISIIVYSNVMIQTPKLIVKGISNTSFSCDCACSSFINNSHYKFKIPKIKRSGKFTADLYDGEKLVQQGMIFETKKAVGTSRDLL
ncbi:MAG: BREX-4 system phosphatase PglZ [Alistipes sp.]|nr:BREX-4 system phosphatase PglZ [Alistipes sp.]